MSRDSEPWLLSYDSLPEVEALYGASASIVTIDRFYTTSRLVSKQPVFAEAVVTNLSTLPAPRRLQVGTQGGSGVIQELTFATSTNDPTATEGSRP